MTKEHLLVSQMEAIVKQVKVIERFGFHLTMIEACETFAGVMAEQCELFGLAEQSNEKELKEWAQKIANKGRIYSAHIVAIRDALRLCKLSSELIEQTNEFIEDGGEDFLNSLKCDNP